MTSHISSLFLTCMAIAQVAYAEAHPVFKFDSTSWAPRCPVVSGKIPRLIPDPTHCRRVFVCTGGTARQFYCPRGHTFDASRQECVYQTACKRGSDEFTSYTSCPDQNGRDTVSFPHPTSCNMYYVCDHGTAYPRQCPPTLHYNEKLRVCDYPYRAKCKARIFTLQP